MQTIEYLWFALILAFADLLLVASEDSVVVNLSGELQPGQTRISAANAAKLSEHQTLALFTLLAQESRVKAIILLKRVTGAPLIECSKLVQSLRTEAPADLSSL